MIRLFIISNTNPTASVRAYSDQPHSANRLEKSVNVSHTQPCHHVTEPSSLEIGSSPNHNYSIECQPISRPPKKSKPSEVTCAGKRYSRLIHVLQPPHAPHTPIHFILRHVPSNGHARSTLESDHQQRQ